MIKYSQHPRFDRQMKKLLKKYRTLEEDLEIAKTFTIELFHNHVPKIDSGSIWLIPNFNQPSIQIYKIKKFACKALRGKGVRSGIRIIYAFCPKTLEVVFLEIYYKEKDNSDMDYEFAKEFIAGWTTL